jgi:hypothetical protein
MNDSIFYWTFYAYNGDSWQGFTVADGGTYNVGQVVNSPTGSHYGYYNITNEVAFGQNLGTNYGSAWQEGATYVYNYYDAATHANYTPWHWQLGEVSGHHGMGSEYDWVGTGGGGQWDDFGFGGYAIA